MSEYQKLFLGIVGVGLVLGPSILSFLEGVNDEDTQEADFINWIMGKSLDQFELLQMCFPVGMLLLCLAVAA